MKRPAWAAAGGFAQAWAALERSAIPHEVGILSPAHPLVIDRRQVEALPGTESGLTPSGKLPFDPLFLDLGGVEIPEDHESEKGDSRGEAWDRASEQFQVRAVLLSAIPHIAADIFLEPRGGGPCEAVANYDDGEEGAGVGSIRPRPERARTDFDVDQAAAIYAMALATRVLEWLQSFNVEIVEASLSPRQRAREVKKGRQIALTVRVKQGKRYLAASQSSGSANYSHRFETRGHYKHHFELKSDGARSKTFERCYSKDASRVVMVDGKECFRFWVPPFVKGPIDKPFVPKVRVVDGP